LWNRDFFSIAMTTEPPHFYSTTFHVEGLHMTDQRRRRGRPRGTGKVDGPYLATIADLLADEPSLTPTAAMKHIIRARTNWGATDATLIRRWQCKWKETGAILLAEAQARKQQRRAMPARLGESSWTGWMKVPAGFEESSAMLALRSLENSSAALALRSVQNSSNVHWLREMRDAFEPAMQTYRELRDTISPLMTAFRDMQDSPTMRLTRDMQDSPTMRLIREMNQRP
jgi:hypothetical protein